MRNYLVKTPRILKMAYSQCIWHVNDNANSVYITFDDGPHPTITPYILSVLKKYNAKATFFCIGQNVEKYLAVYQQILDEGHAVANHTNNHLNGWKTDNAVYFRNIHQAKKMIDSNMFRPPYGRITHSQIFGIHKLFPSTKIIMWDVLSGDFDTEATPIDCLNNVLATTKTGSIIVFHDSDKAWKRLEYVLPRFLDYCKQMKWQMKKLSI
jgi:peptidoglycan/xylan/chitin deacetylase (PgdA/CDA1 family)